MNLLTIPGRRNERGSDWLGDTQARGFGAGPMLSRGFDLNNSPLHILPLAPVKQGLIYFDGSSPHWNSIAFKAVAAATPEVIFITAIKTLNDFRCQRLFQVLVFDKWSQLLKMFFCCFNFWHDPRKSIFCTQQVVWCLINVGNTEIDICEVFVVFYIE